MVVGKLLRRAMNSERLKTNDQRLYFGDNA